jgi:hypothetical protein
VLGNKYLYLGTYGMKNTLPLSYIYVENPILSLFTLFFPCKYHYSICK